MAAGPVRPAQPPVMIAAASGLSAGTPRRATSPPSLPCVIRYRDLLEPRGEVSVLPYCQIDASDPPPDDCFADSTQFDENHRLVSVGPIRRGPKGKPDFLDRAR